MKTLLTALLLASTTMIAPQTMAWGNNNNADAMNTMRNNMMQPIVRTKRSYSGMFRGWYDNNVGFTNQWPWPNHSYNAMQSCVQNCMNMSMAKGD